MTIEKAIRNLETNFGVNRYTASRLNEDEAISDNDINAIFKTVIENNNYFYGIIAGDESRYRKIYKKIVYALRNLHQQTGDIVDRIVCNNIRFKNGSCIRIFSASQYNHPWGSYKFNSIFFDDGMPLIHYSYIQHQVKIINYYEAQEAHSYLKSQEPEPQDNNNLWEEMILYGIKA